MQYNEALKRAREYKELEQKNIAKILKTTQQQISLYETGQRELKASFLMKLCKLYDVPADYILGFTNDKKPLPKR